jgi:hypothetical protein
MFQNAKMALSVATLSLCYPTERLGLVVNIFLRIREVKVSNLGFETGYSDRDLSMFLLNPSSQIPG